MFMDTTYALSVSRIVELASTRIAPMLALLGWKCNALQNKLPYGPVRELMGNLDAVHRVGDAAR
jgi:hypothetical protein